MPNTSIRWWFLLMSTGLLIVSTACPTAETTLKARQEDPCAAAARSFVDGQTPAEYALSCLRSVPLQVEAGATQLSGLRTLLQYQSDLAYLSSSQRARLYPDVDLLLELDELEQRLHTGFYSNEYDFQLDISHVFASAYDGHLVYQPDIVDVFHFFRREAGEAFPLVSVSQSGIGTPQIYGARDLVVLSHPAGASYQPSPITEIDGREAQEALEEHACYAGNLHDLDSNYNLLFQNLHTENNGLFERIHYYVGGSKTRLTFANGTERHLDIVAKSTLDLSGLTDGQDLFDRCCRGTLLDAFEPVLNGMSSVLERRQDMSLLKSLLRQISEDVQSKSPPLTAKLKTRQASRFTVARLWDESIAGYFLDFADDLAVLRVASFLPSAPLEDFQATVRSFLSLAHRSRKTRLIIDLTGNQGGAMFMPHDLFRQLFPGRIPYDASNYRATPSFNFTGAAISRHFEYTPPDFFTPQAAASELFSGPGNPFNYQQQLNSSYSTFGSWEDLFGPQRSPSGDDAFTSLIRPDLYNQLQTNFSISWDRTMPQVFAAENITLLQDGGCASACALFSEFMKNDAPGPGRVRQVVIGGRPQNGPMQGVGGVKGGSLGTMLVTLLNMLQALEYADAELTAEFERNFARTLRPYIVALDRAADNQASINLRNSFRQDDESVTPLQYVYEAADCRLYQTAQMLEDERVLWRKVYEAMWEDGECVPGSTGHSSSLPRVDYDAIDIPEDARSNFSISPLSRSLRGHGDQVEESGGPVSRWSTLVVCFAVVAHVAGMIASW